MRLRPLASLALASALVALAAACTRAPYVYQKEEFNRERKDFGQDPVDIAKLIVCYGSRSTTPEAVTKLAETECGKFNKRAVFVKQDVYECPLLAPVGAHYNCLAQEPPPPGRTP